MKLRVERNVYELSIDGVLKQHEFYDDATLALESAMDDIFEGEISKGMWLTKPVLLNIPISNIYYWRVSIMRSKEIVNKHTIEVRRSVILGKV